jgi:hypothetical protein
VQGSGSLSPVVAQFSLFAQLVSILLEFIEFKDGYNNLVSVTVFYAETVTINRGEFLLNLVTDLTQTSAPLCSLRKLIGFRGSLKKASELPLPSPPVFRPTVINCLTGRISVGIQHRI